MIETIHPILTTKQPKESKMGKNNETKPSKEVITPDKIYPYCGFLDWDCFAAFKYTQKESCLYIFTEKEYDIGDIKLGDCVDIEDFVANYLANYNLPPTHTILQYTSSTVLEEAPGEILNSFNNDDIPSIKKLKVCKFTFTIKTKG